MTTPVRDLPTRYGMVAMTLHWTIAAAIIVNLYIGLSLDDLGRTERMQALFWHKSIGVLVLALSVARIVWRWINPVPPPSQGLNPWMRVAGTAMHHLFYFLIVAVPLAGWLMVSTFGIQTSFFGLFNVPPVRLFSGREAHEAFETAHVVLAWAMLGLIPLHIVAGLYHHLVRRDNTLLRMLPGTKLREGA